MSTTIDPAIRVKPSKELVAYIEAVDVKPESLKNINVDSQIELSDIKWIFETQLAHPNECPSFHELLQGSSVLLPKPEFPPRNPELDARIQKLKAQQEHREYNEMVSNVDGSSLKAQKDLSDIPISQQVKEINSYLILIFQFVVSTATGFAFGYFAPFFLYGIQSVGKRLLVGIIIAFVVAIADLYFIIRGFLEEDGVIDLKSKFKKHEKEL